jgi:DNA-binding GntR family transcriptional regulator
MEDKMKKQFDYEVIYDYLINKIRKDLSANEKIPSENELCSLFKTTRTTVRQGINKLKSEGIIFSKQGSGCFVSPEKINYTLSPNTVFSNEINKLGQFPSIKILEIQNISPSDFIIKKFGMEKSLNIHKVTLIRMVDNIPILIGYSFLNLALLPNIDTNITSSNSFTKIFKEYGLEPIRNHSELEIVLSDKKTMQLLQMQNNLPLIKIASTSLDKKSGRIIEYVESYFRSDLVKISIDFSKNEEVVSLIN